jgi:hypothetical protein
MPRSGAWTGGQDPSIHRRKHPTFHLGRGQLDCGYLAEKAGSRFGAELSPGLSPFWTFSAEVPLLSTMVTSSGCRPQSGGALSENSNEVMMALTFFSPVREDLVIVQRQGSSCTSWSNDLFSFSHRLWIFLRTSGADLLEIYLWGETPPPVTLGPLWYTYW